MKHSVCILWFENINPEILSVVPSLKSALARGVDLHLTPLPLVEKRVCYYQTLTGMGSGKFGRFDTVRPEAYRASLEDDIPDGVLGRLLPDILRSHGLTAALVEARNLDELGVIARQARDCTIVRFPGVNDAGAIESIVQRSNELTALDTHLLVLTDVWCESATKFVNVNTFLADIELLEVDVPRSREHIVWPETLAYGMGTGQIWINLRGREPQGCVAPGREYQQVREALQQELSAWKDPETGEAIVTQVSKKEDIYTGEYLFKASDLIVEYCPGYASSPQAVALGFDAVAVSKAGTAGKAHAPYARLIASGPNLISGHAESARLVDVMPCVMYLLGQAAPKQIDGKVITSLFTPSHRQEHPQEYSEDDEALLSSEEERHIEGRLRALGYLG